MRPKSIVTFERLALLAVVVAILVTALTWNGNAAAYRRSGYGPEILWLMTAAEFAIGLLLIFLISRKGNGIAKWILVILTALGVIELGLGIGDRLGGGWVGIAEIAKMLLLVAAVSFLFRADAKPWFRRRLAGEGQPDGREPAS